MEESKKQHERRLARERQRKWNDKENELIKQGDPDAIARRKKKNYSRSFSAAKGFIKHYPSFEDFEVLRNLMAEQEAKLRENKDQNSKQVKKAVQQ